jgi:hypothetical protein
MIHLISNLSNYSCETHSRPILLARSGLAYWDTILLASKPQGEPSQGFHREYPWRFSSPAAGFAQK